MVVEGLIEGLVRSIGWASLKLVSAGRYRSASDEPTRLFEGALGLLIIAGAFVAVYSLAS